MAGPGKQRKLGHGPGSGVCGSRVRPGSCVGVTGRPAPACTLPARGKHKASLREPAAPAAHLPPRVSGPAEGEGAANPAGAGRQRGGEAAGGRALGAAVEEGSAGGRAAPRHGYCGWPGI